MRHFPLSLCLLTLAAPLQAAPAPPDISQRLIAAAAEPATLRTAVIAAIAERPFAVDEIVAEAAALAPASRGEIAAAAAAAFPGFAERIRAAAGAAPKAAVSAASPWSGEIALGGARSSGNTETAQAAVGVKAQYDGEAWEHEFNLDFDYGSEDDETTEQRLLTNFESRRDLTERLYGFGFLQYEDDRFSGFDYETTEGLGLGYRIALGPPVKWRVQAGPGARQSREKASGETDNEFIGLFRSDLEWRFSESGKLANTTTVTVGSERTVTRNVSALTVTLIGDLAGRASFDVQHNSAPPPRTEATDTTTKLSLVYGF